MGFELTKQFISKPPVGTLINWGDPITRGLVSCVPYNEGSGTPRDIINPLFGQSSTVPSWQAGRKELTAGISKFDNAKTTPLSFESGPFTIASFVNVYALALNDAFPALLRRYHDGGNGNNAGWTLFIYPPNSATFPNRFTFDTQRNDNAPYPGILDSGVNHDIGDWFVVGTSNGLSKSIWVNGKLCATSTVNPNPIAESNNPMQVNTQGVLNAYIHYCWNRELTANEIVRLYQNPYCIFYQSALPIVNGSPDVTINIDPLSLSISVVSPIAEVKIIPNALSITATLTTQTPLIISLASALSAALSLQTGSKTITNIPQALQATFGIGGFTPTSVTNVTVILSPLSLSISVVAPNPEVKNIPAALPIVASQPSSIPTVTKIPLALSLSGSVSNATPVITFLASALGMAASLGASISVVTKIPGSLTGSFSLQAGTPMVIVLPSGLTATFTLVPLTPSGVTSVTVILQPLTLTASVVAPVKEVKVSPLSLLVNGSVQGSTKEVKIAPNALTLAIATNTLTPEVKALIGPQSLTSLLGGTVPNVISIPAPLNISAVLVSPAISIIFNTTVILAPLTLTMSLGGMSVAATIYRRILQATKHNTPIDVSRKNPNYKISTDKQSKRTTKANVIKDVERDVQTKAVTKHQL